MFVFVPFQPQNKCLTVYFISITANEKVKQEIDLAIEMMVEVRVHGKPYYGVVKWLGSVEVNGKMVNMAGLEMVG